jgi:drug/metabolite transporter (DMT)-like permease
VDETSIGHVKPRHVAIAVLIAAIWGANFVVIDVGLAALPPLLFLGERITGTDAVATLLIVGGVALGSVRRRRTPVRPESLAQQAVVR